MVITGGLEMGELCVAEKLAGWPARAEELRAMRKLPGRNGPRYESLGAHDDLVMALALALFGARMRPLALEGWRLRVGLEQGWGSNRGWGQRHLGGRCQG